MTKETNKQNKGGMKTNGIVAAIIVAGLIIAGAIIFVGSNGGGGGGNYNDTPREAVSEQAPSRAERQNAENSQVTINPVDGDDHVFGSPDAQVKIVEFSDFECPFCGRVHTTLEQVVEEYDGQVAWVYRHLPLTQIHPNAERIAQASECVAELGGNDAFWAFADGFFKGQIGATNLSGLAAIVPSVNQAAIESCVASGKYEAAVAADISDARSAGGRGTPYSVVIGPDGQQAVISGAQPIGVWREAIDQMLQ